MGTSPPMDDQTPVVVATTLLLPTKRRRHSSQGKGLATRCTSPWGSRLRRTSPGRDVLTRGLRARATAWKCTTVEGPARPHWVDDVLLDRLQSVGALVCGSWDLAAVVGPLLKGMPDLSVGLDHLNFLD